VFWVISVYFNIRNTLPKSGTFLLRHPVYVNLHHVEDLNFDLILGRWRRRRRRRRRGGGGGGGGGREEEEEEMQ